METPANTVDLAVSGAPRTARLGYPPPPKVRVNLSLPEATELHGLCQLTGHTVGEVAAILLAEQVSGDSAQVALCAAASALRSLHAQRRQVLGINNLPAGKPEAAILYPASEAGPILIPLSVPLNQQLSDWAIESGLTRPEAAKILLRKTDLQALAKIIGEATGPAAVGAAGSKPEMMITKVSPAP